MLNISALYLLPACMCKYLYYVWWYMFLITLIIVMISVAISDATKYPLTLAQCEKVITTIVDPSTS